MVWPFKRKTTESHLVEYKEPVLNMAFQNADSRSMSDFFDMSSAAAGQQVSERTAMRLSAVHACVRIIAGSLSSLALHLYKRTESGRERISNDPLWWLLNEQPTPRYSGAAMWEFVARSILLRGDAFLLINRNGFGQAVELIPLSREQVIAEREGNRLKYFIYDDGKAFGVQQEDMLHFPGIGFDGVCSESVVSHYGRTSFGMALAAEDHAARFFSAGTMQKFALMNKGRMSPEALESLRNQWVSTYGGTVNSQKPLVLIEGTEIKELSLSAADAQLLQTRAFSVEDICRFFGVPPHMVGHTEKTTSWGTGLEQMSTAFVLYTLRPHLVRIEQELNRKFFKTAGRFFEFEVNSLMRGDSQAQANFFKTALGGSGGSGWMTQNEVRGLQNLPPIEGGDVVSTFSMAPKADVASALADPSASGQDPINFAVLTVNELRKDRGLNPIDGGDKPLGQSSAPAEYRFNDITKQMERIV